MHGSVRTCEYLFSGNKKYLAEIYPILKGASEFYQDFLIQDKKTGYLVVSPSNSPENTPGFWNYEETKPDGTISKERANFFRYHYEQSNGFDLLSSTIEAANTLKVDKKFIDELIQIRALLRQCTLVNTQYRMNKFGIGSFRTPSRFAPLGYVSGTRNFALYNS